MEFKKNIVLTALESNAQQKAILSYYKDNDKYKFDFKGINFLPKNRLLGVYINEKLYKYDLNNKTISFDLDLKGTINNVSVVVLDRQNMLKPFLWGSQLITDNDFVLNKVIEEINIKTINEDKIIEKEEQKFENNTIEQAKNKIEENSIEDTFSQENIEATENKENLESNSLPKSTFSLSENLLSLEEKYDINMLREQTLNKEENELNEFLDTFQNEIDSVDENLESKENLDQQKKEPEFYAMISSQVEKMLKNNETEKLLEDIIPDSKFVQVPKANGESYIFGIIYDNGVPKYLCYGERGKFSEERPEHLKAYYQWLPIDVDNVSGDGYYMMYQDATTGKNLEMTVI